MSLEKEIPTWSYINFEILYQIHLAKEDNMLSKLTLNDIIKKTSNHIGANISLNEFYSPINSGSIFSFLYSLLVVPKELFTKENYNKFEDFQFEIENYFEIIVGENLITPKYKLFRILRNSISHVNYKIDMENKYSLELWNRNKQGEINVKLKSDINRLSNFAIEIAKFYMTLP
ncbi:MAG: hypothetical protein KDD29_10025 [Flavobacteriales bacterium]|nr:hypothetical protein [Flavobacteriales bacterium]